MTSKTLRRVLTVLTVAWLLSGMAILTLTRDVHDNNLRIWFFDVGQGDGMLIRTPYHQDIIIDGGPSNTLVGKVGRTLPFWDRDIELLFVTHPHTDHYKGLFNIIKKYKVERIMMSDVDSPNATYTRFIEEITKRNIPITFIHEPLRIRMGKNLTFDIMYPDHALGAYKNMNDSSVVGLLTFQNTTVMLPGDLEAKGEKYLVAQKRNLKADVLKVGHHGSKTSTSEAWLNAVDPEYAVVSVGVRNGYGHPAPSVIERLKTHNVTTYRTDQHGDIILNSDGNSIHFKTQK